MYFLEVICINATKSNENISMPMAKELPRV